MVRNRVLLTMENGEKYALAGYASDVAEKVNTARNRRSGNGLLALERAVIPTGQMVHIDPDRVSAIRDER